MSRDPRSITIYGAGVIGCEYASIFRNFGIKVNLVNSRGKLLSFLDDERMPWAASAASGVLSLEQRAHLRLAITGAMEASRKVVDFAFRAAGTTAIFEGSAFERRFRDLHTLLAQGQAHLANLESAGQALFGTEPAQRL